MRRIQRFLFVLVAATLCACTDMADSPGLRGEYFGLSEPDDVPKVFAPGIVSHGFHEHGLTISPDGDELFYGTSNRNHSHYTIVHWKEVNGRWQTPGIASFAGDHGDMVPRFSPDGNRLYFSSRRPHKGTGRPQGDFDIYVVERAGDSWGEPRNLGAPVNTAGNEFAPAVSSAGNLYFQCWDENGSTSDICFSRFLSGAFRSPERLGFGINAEGYDGGPFIAPDESYLLFHSLRPGNLGDAPNTNIYISFRTNDETWGTPVNLGEDINGSGNPISPIVSPDGRFLFFATNSPRSPPMFPTTSFDRLLQEYRSHQNGYGALYWVNAGVIDQLRERGQ